MNRFLSWKMSPWAINILLGIRQTLIIAGVIAFGVLLAYLLVSPRVALTVSLIGVLLHVLIILVNPLNGLLFWFVFFPFSERVVNIPLPAGIPDLSPTRFVIAFLAIMILGQVAIRKRVWPRLTKLDWAIVAFMIGILLSTATADNPLLGIQFVLDSYLVPLIIYFLAKNLITSRKDIMKVFSALLIVGAYAAVIIISEQTTSYILNFQQAPDIIVIEYLYVSYTTSLRMARVPLFGSVDGIGQVFAMVIPIAFYLMFKSPSGAKKVWYVMLIGLMFVGVFYTYKRTAYLSIPISFFVIQFFYPQFRRIFFVILVVFGLVLAVTWTQVSNSALVNERIQGSDLEGANGRTDMWTRSWDLWKQRPISGWGFRRLENLDGGTAQESLFFLLLTSAGLVGFVPYVLMMIFVIFDSIVLFFRVRLNPHNLFVDRTLIAIFWGATLPYLLHSFQGNQAHQVTNVIFMLLIGTIVGSQQAISVNKKEEKLGASNA